MLDKYKLLLIFFFFLNNVSLLILLIFFFFLTTPCGFWDLSSLTRDQTWATAMTVPSPNH